jgi:hypothetical protein
MERFWSKVLIGDGCWNWTASRHWDGYGQFSVGNTKVKAHRHSWALANGPVPRGAKVLHRCDNPACVRPAHLFVGTSSENNLDAVAKSRAALGERHANSKLTPDAVRSIRGGAETDTEKARAFGVSRRAVAAVRMRQTWKHVL